MQRTYAATLVFTLLVPTVMKRFVMYDAVPTICTTTYNRILKLPHQYKFKIQCILFVLQLPFRLVV